MSKNKDYFYRRNKSVVERLLRGDRPSVIASDYEMTLAAVENQFPECNYRKFSVTVKRRFAMGESSYEIARILNHTHSLVLSVLNMTFPKESLLYAITRMHDNGFSITKIKRVTGLSTDDIRDVLLQTGRDNQSMRYYKVIGKGFSIKSEDDNWLHNVCKDVVEFEMPNYLMTLENKIEEKYRSKSKKIYSDIASEELEDYSDDDNTFAEKLIDKLKRLKGISKKDLIAKAIIYYAKSAGVIDTGGGIGGKELTRIKNRTETEIDEFYLSMAEIKQTKHNEMQKRFLEKHQSKNQNL